MIRIAGRNVPTTRPAPPSVSTPTCPATLDSRAAIETVKALHDFTMAGRKAVLNRKPSLTGGKLRSVLNVSTPSYLWHPCWPATRNPLNCKQKRNKAPRTNHSEKSLFNYDVTAFTS